MSTKMQKAHDMSVLRRAVQAAARGRSLTVALYRLLDFLAPGPQPKTCFVLLGFLVNMLTKQLRIRRHRVMHTKSSAEQRDRGGLRKS